MIDAIVTALGTLAHLQGIFCLLLGSFVGFVFGVIPGVGGIQALILMLPFTYGMDPMLAMFIYSGIMGVSAFGGSIPAILIRVPGENVNMATTFDGYPMTQKGEASKALGISAGSLFFGCLVSVFSSIALLPLARALVLAFGPPEVFMLVLFGIVASVVCLRGNLVKALITACLGLFFSFVGPSIMTGATRYGLATTYLRYGGVPLVPFILGLFAIGQMISLSVRGTIITQAGPIPNVSFRDSLEGVKEVLRHKICFFRSAIIGIALGILPGVGATAAGFMSYLSAMQASKHPETFGKGNPEGVIASETAVNAEAGGALLTTVSFGIPGNAAMAVLLGAFILHGLTPGPMLVREHMDLVLALMFGLIFSAMLFCPIGLVLASRMSAITRLDASILVPVVSVISLVASYMLNQRILDVFLTLFAGMLGYLLEKYGFSLVPITIGLVLGNLAEASFHQSVEMSLGNYYIFFTRPFSLAIFCTIILALSLPFISPLLKKRQRSQL